jgi:hypothetical protein
LLALQLLWEMLQCLLRGRVQRQAVLLVLLIVVLLLLLLLLERKLQGALAATSSI